LELKLIKLQLSTLLNNLNIKKTKKKMTKTRSQKMSRKIKYNIFLKSNNKQIYP